MGRTQPYLKIISNLQRRTPMRLRLRAEDDAIWLGEVRFTVATSAELLKTSAPGTGILVDDLTPEEVRLCRDRRISFLTAQGRLYLATRDHTLQIEPHRAPSAAKPDRKRALAENRILPTVLVSPNAFAILDVLFRLKREPLQKFKSALAFTRAYGLYQPKLSTMMTALGAKTIVDLKTAVARLPDDWWLMALHYPLTKRGLTPFFAAAKPYHSLQPAGDRVLPEGILNGPVEVAKEFGLLRDADVQLWVSDTNAQDLKRKFRLIPGESAAADQTWWLATPALPFEREALLSRMTPVAKNPANLFRTIWDLGFGDLRAREAQLMLLKKVLHEN